MPIIGQSQVVRSEWYDRNPLVITETFWNETGPHGSITRWTYTIPAGRRCMIMSTLVRGYRITAATAIGRWGAIINLGGGGQETGFILYSASFDNTIAGVLPPLMGNQILLGAGDIVKGFTSDGSTGGTTNMALSMHGVEFDA